jgi:hypothetical protein
MYVNLPLPNDKSWVACRWILINLKQGWLFIGQICQRIICTFVQPEKSKALFMPDKNLLCEFLVEYKYFLKITLHTCTLFLNAKTKGFDSALSNIALSRGSVLFSERFFQEKGGKLCLTAKGCMCHLISENPSWLCIVFEGELFISIRFHTVFSTHRCPHTWWAGG